VDLLINNQGSCDGGGVSENELEFSDPASVIVAKRTFSAVSHPATGGSYRPDFDREEGGFK
jgi:hypothetical protein